MYSNNIASLKKLCLKSCLEPLGSVAPKIANLNDKLQVTIVMQGSQFAMQCPGQAYPVPIVR